LLLCIAFDAQIVERQDHASIEHELDVISQHFLLSNLCAPRQRLPFVAAVWYDNNNHSWTNPGGHWTSSRLDHAQFRSSICARRHLASANFAVSLVANASMEFTVVGSLVRSTSVQYHVSSWRSATREPHDLGQTQSEVFAKCFPFFRRTAKPCVPRAEKVLLKMTSVLQECGIDTVGHDRRFL
jgi:hypothetical protein